MHAFRTASCTALRLASAAAGLALLTVACATQTSIIAEIEPVGADASVSGTITYRERIALSPDAVVTVQLRDTSLADAAAVLISEQVINSPGQVPIDFEVRYASDELDGRNTYSISAVITESDGRMAFINDTAYDVITRGNPRRVDMTLVMVEPPPELAPDGWSRTDPERIEAPVHVTDTHMVWEGTSGNLQVVFATSSEDGCYRIGREEAVRKPATLSSHSFDVTVTAWVPSPLPWAQDCSDRDLELDAFIHLGDDFFSGETVEVTLNDQANLTFTVP